MPEIDEEERTDPHLKVPDDAPTTPPLPKGGSSVPPRAPPPWRPPTIPPPASRPPSATPNKIPRPSDPAPPRAPPPAGVAERQRLMQMQTQLDEARSTIARQKHELDELRERMADGDRRLGEILDSLRTDARGTAMEERLRLLEATRAELEGELRRHVAETELRGRERGGAIDRLQTRLSEFADGEASRLRMRMERLAAQARELEEKALTIEHSQHFLRERLAKLEEAEQKRAVRFAEIEESFDELAETVREQRDASDADSLRARLDAIEALVLRTGDEEAKLRKEVASLRDSVAPPPPAGDDLTRIKGVGPKFAKALAAAGVTTFAQIAAWTPEDVERYAVHLGIKADRIRKAGWIASAVALAPR